LNGEVGLLRKRPRQRVRCLWGGKKRGKSTKREKGKKSPQQKTMFYRGERGGKRRSKKELGKAFPQKVMGRGKNVEQSKPQKQTES